MKRVVRFTTPHILSTREGQFWTCLIDGERVTLPAKAGVLTELKERIRVAKAARRRRVQP